MTALMLAEAGCRPLLVERGAQTETRQPQVKAFWRQALLDPESNVLYGEGGAGLFSDGKLTARSKDRSAIRHFFETLVACGASPDILIDAEPHIGSDVLAEIIPALVPRTVRYAGLSSQEPNTERMHASSPPGTAHGMSTTCSARRPCLSKLNHLPLAYVWNSLSAGSTGPNTDNGH
jgi:hypothetical protein